MQRASLFYTVEAQYLVSQLQIKERHKYEVHPKSWTNL
jgi:hypothetical protein